MVYLEAGQVGGLEVVGRAAAPVHDVLVLALAAQLAVPVGEPQVVVHHGLTVDAVLQHRVEEGLGEGRGGSLCELADAELGESHQFDVIRDLRFLQSRRLGDKDTR